MEQGSLTSHKAEQCRPEQWRNFSQESNSSFSSSKNSYFQNKAQCETFLMKISFICMRIKKYFHINRFARSLALKQRLGATRKWAIVFFHYDIIWLQVPEFASFSLSHYSLVTITWRIMVLLVKWCHCTNDPFPTIESIGGMGTNFRRKDFWHRLGCQELVMIGRWHLR